MTPNWRVELHPIGTGKAQTLVEQEGPAVIVVRAGDLSVSVDVRGSLTLGAEAYLHVTSPGDLRITALDFRSEGDEPPRELVICVDASSEERGENP